MTRISIVLCGIGLLAACARPPLDPRTPAEIASPAPDAWREAANDLADSIHAKLGHEEIAGPLQLDAIHGDVPSYFRDLLLAGLVGRGVPVAETPEAPARIACRATTVGQAPRPRGLTHAAAALRAEILVLCLVDRGGTYVAAAQHILPIPPAERPPRRGVVIEVTG